MELAWPVALSVPAWPVALSVPAWPVALSVLAWPAWPVALSVPAWPRYVKVSLASFESFLGCAESAILKSGKPIRMREHYVDEPDYHKLSHDGLVLTNPF